MFHTKDGGFKFVYSLGVTAFGNMTGRQEGGEEYISSLQGASVNNGVLRFGADGVQQSNGGNDVLDPSTVGKNFLGLSYPGSNNPMTYGGKPDYTTVPKVWSEYPAIGHDRRYDKLGITGAKGLLLDSRALYADLQFIAEEKTIFFNPGTPLFDRATAGLFSLGMSIAIIPKTATTLSTPTGIINFVIGAAMTYKVNNIPGK